MVTFERIRTNWVARFLCFLGLIFAFPSPALSQFGIKGGLAISGIQASHSDIRHASGEDYRPFLGYEIDWIQDEDAGYADVGIQIGGFYSKSLSERFILQPELYYAQRGLNFDKVELYNSTYKLNIHYLQLPVLVKYKIGKKGKFQPGIMAGPYANLRLKATRTLELLEDSDTKSVSNVNTLDYGLALAMDMEFGVWSGLGMFEVRFDWGFGSVMTQPESYRNLHEEPGKVKMLAFIFMLGYRF